jgi:pimeloyl-ACP methyl ester carboxylesterase
LGNLPVNDPKRSAILRDAAARCREQLTKQGVDLSAYSTQASADDLEDLRRVLGYKSWNLYGVSYSTKLMLEVVRKYPETVRSVVLDSPLPPQVSYDEESVTNWHESLTLLFRDCATDSACNKAFRT